MPVKEKIVYFLTAAFFVTLFLPDMPVVTNIVTGALLSFLFFSTSMAEKGRLLRKRKEIVLMILFFLLHIVSALLSFNKREGLDMVVLRLDLLVFPVSLGVYAIRERLKDRILLVFSIVVTGMAILCLGHAIRQYREFHDAGFLYDDSLSELVRLQSIYVALMVNIALFSYVYLLSKKFFSSLWGRVGVWLAVAFLAIFHFMLASRIGIITLYSSLLVFAIYNMIWKRKLVMGVIVVVGLPVAALLLVHFFPKTLNRFRELNYPGYRFDSHARESHYNMQLTPDQWNGANIRLAIWKCGWELAREHWLTGVPLGDKEQKLIEVFRARQFDFAVQSRRNMHNTYLDVLCNFGVIGLGVFLLGFLVLPLAGCYRYRDGWGAFTILAFGAAMITETWLDRSLGCLLLGFFLSLISACQGKDQDDRVHAG